METTAPNKETATPQSQADTTPAPGHDFFKLDDKSREAAFNDFVGHMQQPREKMEDSPLTYSDPLTDPTRAPEEEPLTEDDEGNIGFFNYDEDHHMTALFCIGLLDSGMGFIGTMATGLEPERYQRFANRTPPDYYVQATAAMVKKYHARLSLEWMFFTAVAMAYGPVLKKVRQDRKELAKRAKAEADLAEEQRLQQIIESRKNNGQKA